jgi:TolB-like protein/tetratricopeptide (TPR) repeat protein
MRLTSTGVPALDDILGGGFLDRSAILIEGPSSNEKEDLAYEFMRSGLDLGDFCLYVTRLTPGEVLSDARALGINLDRGMFWMCPENGDRSYAPEDLASISFGIKSVLKEHEARKIRVVFDLPSQLLMAGSSDSVFRFLGQLLTDLKKYDATLVATVQADMHAPPVLAGLELIFDGALEVRQSEHAKAEIRIKKMRGVVPVKSSLSISPSTRAPAEFAQPQLGANRIAILPFVNMSPDPNDEFFADGLTEELIDRLCQIRGLEVIARTSVMVYKNKEKKAAEIGNELRVRSLVEGSVRKAGNIIRVTAQLIDVKTEGHLWSSRYDSELKDIFAVQSDIAERISEALRLNLIDTEKKKIGRKATSIPEAYVAYLNGIYFRYKASFVGLKKAAQYNSEAIRLDPNFAEAYAQLATDYVFLGVFWGEPVDQAFSRAKELAAKALELDPGLAEAYYARSWVSYFYEMNWGAAEREGRKAVELEASYAEPRISLAYTLLGLGRNDEALGEARKAVDLDPLGVFSHLVLARVLSIIGKFDEAILWHNKSIEIEPNSAFFHSELGYTYLHMGKVVEGVREMEKAMALPDSEPFKAGLGYGYAISGRREEALKIVTELELARGKGMARPYDIALVYSGLGENSKALDLLDQAYQEHSIVRLLLLSVEPSFRNLRPDPRFKALLNKLSLQA